MWDPSAPLFYMRLSEQFIRIQESKIREGEKATKQEEKERERNRQRGRKKRRGVLPEKKRKEKKALKLVLHDKWLFIDPSRPKQIHQAKVESNALSPCILLLGAMLHGLLSCLLERVRGAWE